MGIMPDCYTVNRTLVWELISTKLFHHVAKLSKDSTRLMMNYTPPPHPPQTNFLHTPLNMTSLRFSMFFILPSVSMCLDHFWAVKGLLLVTCGLLGSLVCKTQRHNVSQPIEYASMRSFCIIRAIQLSTENSTILLYIIH